MLFNDFALVFHIFLSLMVFFSFEIDCSVSRPSEASFLVRGLVGPIDWI